MSENSKSVTPTTSSKAQSVGVEQMAPEDKTTKSSTIFERSQSLMEVADNTFHELCKTLENEQLKLHELERRRQKLQEEMLLLKAEIEEQKRVYRMSLVESIADNLALNMDVPVLDFQPPANDQPQSETTDMNGEQLEVTEAASTSNGNDDAGVVDLEQKTLDIHEQLENVRNECVIEQYRTQDQSEKMENVDN